MSELSPSFSSLQKTAVIDPSVAQPVLDKLEKRQWNLDYIWNTHHHWDHVGGNKDLVLENPDLLIFGHADLIKDNTLSYLRDNYKNLKISQWFLDPLVKNGPDFDKNKSRILDKIEYTDTNFITTSPDVLNFLPKKKKCLFMPNPTDPSFEVLNNYENQHCSMDVFFALSHGVHRGILKRGKYDERADFVNRLVEITPNVKFDLYGINNVQPIWADTFLKSI